ncbi:hypothetical protein HNQ99_000383 [Rhizorhapis suberifaciens]|uniref:Uncharacterized protein n=2 Tax=Rhizorhapis suberifaciens TaxID=13656 RepID=A0A840HQG0_9SPHN|nr:hypothetical protein [Rhizorhapis suberifaciens]
MMSGIFLVMALLVNESPSAPIMDGPAVQVEQVQASHDGAADVSVPNIGSATDNPTSVPQLPNTLDAPREAPKGEAVLATGGEKKDLAAEVARALEFIRQRGQQPTPEILAREIGPDALAAYLNQDPAHIDIFSTTNDTHPLPAGDPAVPDGVQLVRPASPEG